MTPWLTEAPAAIAVIALIIAALADVIEFEVPNTLSIVVAAMAVVYGLLHPGTVWWSHALALVLMFAFGLLAFARGWLGGGDVKLMTATAAWTGIFGLPTFFLATSLAGGVLLCTLYAVRRGWRAVGLAAPVRVKVLNETAPIPYAVAVAVGAIWWAFTRHPASIF